MQPVHGQCINKTSNRADLSYRAMHVLHIFSSNLSTEYFKDELCAIPIEKLKIFLIILKAITRLLNIILLKFAPQKIKENVLQLMLEF